MTHYDSEIIEIIQGNPEQDLWLHGELKAQPDCIFFAKVYDRKSKFGIKGGRVSKLEIFRCGELYKDNPKRGDLTRIAHYDRGWSERAVWWNLRERKALRLILRAFEKEVC